MTSETARIEIPSRTDDATASAEIEHAPEPVAEALPAAPDLEEVGPRRKRRGRHKKLRGTGNPKRPFAFNPFITMWRRPRATIRAVVAIAPKYMVSSLASLAGIGQALDNASSLNTGARAGVLGTLFVAMIAGPIGGMFALWLVGWIVEQVGRLLGGQASRNAVRAALAWSMVPVIWALLLWIPKILVFGDEIFMSDMTSVDTNPFAAFALMVFLVLDVGAALWTFVLMGKSLSEVEGFSVWRAAAALVLGWVLYLGVGVGIGAVIALAQGQGRIG